jgi:hypothetical protein
LLNRGSLPVAPFEVVEVRVSGPYVGSKP